MNEVQTGKQDGTGAAIDIELGWLPSHVTVINTESATMEQLDWYDGMSNGHAVKTVTGTVARTKITSNGITILNSTFQGFRIGADTDVNVAGETLFWIAYRAGT